MWFENEAAFIAFLRDQTETNYAYVFKPGSQYPFTVTLKRTPDRLIVTEVTSV